MVREKIEDWMMDYNYHRLHEALDYRAPVELLEALH